MSEILEIDPKQGFVAFPVALFDLDLTPGAFRTLAELCRMANAEGQCWPSLGQLGRRLGRSRAAISGYIAELRELGVVETEEQRMANGYNYRLRYTLPFWKAWRARKTEGQPGERRVQPSERPLKTKNQSLLKQPSPSDEIDLVADWKAAIRKAPYPAFEVWPSQNLIARTKVAASQAAAPPISADIGGALQAFFAKKQVAIAPDTLRESAAYLGKSLTSAEAVQAFIAALERDWQDHWRKPPNTFQLARMLKALAPQQGQASQIKLLKTYLRRWEIYCENLPSGAKRSSVG